MSTESESTSPADESILWYCLKAQPKHEAIAARALRSEVGVEVFAPSIRFQRARGQGKMWVCEAMFPGYLFARFVYRDHFRHVASVRGVSQIVRFGGIPAVLPDAVIHELRELVAGDEVITVKAAITPGDEIQIATGVFQGLHAIVTRVIPARDRVAILLELLGEVREIEVSSSDLLLKAAHPLRN